MNAQRIGYAGIVFLSGSLVLSSAESAEAQQARIAFGRGVGHLEKGEPDKAIADRGQPISLAPPGFYYKRGNGYYRKGEFDKAIADFTEAIRLNPRFTEAYYNRAVVHGKKGDRGQAIADFTEAILLYPEHADT